MAGNGSDEIIDLLLRVVARPGQDNVLCYAATASACTGSRRGCAAWRYREVPRGEDYRLPLEFLAEAADERTALVFVTSPDNPTGLAARAEELMVLSGVLPAGTLLVVDEAYMDFSWPPEEYSMLHQVAELDNLVVSAHLFQGLRPGGPAPGLRGSLPAWLAAHLRRAPGRPSP